jgi:hypothetical protein
MAEAPLPEKNITDFGQTKTLGRGQKGKGIVIMYQHVYSQLLTDMKFSPQIEEGGYLPGKAYRKTGSPENVDDPNFQWIVEITDAVLAQNTRASSGALVFSGDSWSKISRQMDTEFSGKKLIGWFHTHLFEASDKFGLSGLDQDLHCQFLKKPFQIAILINISPDHQREVRCFQYGPSGFLEECLFEVTQ